jgi:hypothetical protein
MPLQVLLDAGVVIHSEFAERALKEGPLCWSDGSVLKVSGLKRKQAHDNEDFRKRTEALFTVGRMIREGKIEAYTYNEIGFEIFRGRVGIQEFNALQGCMLHRCAPAIERSRFRRTSDFMDFFAKGGKKDPTLFQSRVDTSTTYIDGESHRPHIALSVEASPTPPKSRCGKPTTCEPPPVG